MGFQIRLDKMLSEMSAASRSEVKDLLRTGRLKINEEREKKADRKVDIEKDVISLDGTTIEYEAVQYFLLHKPAGFITATEDRTQKTVMELLPEIRRRDLSPVGRLDKDTEGLLLITNDGALAHRLLSPRHHIEKVYYAEIEGLLSEDDENAFAQGIDIGDEKPTLPAELKILSNDELHKSSVAEITITEGRYHQVKRMFEALGKKVVYLKRIAMGNLRLPQDLPAGSFIKLTQEEIAQYFE